MIDVISGTALAGILTHLVRNTLGGADWMRDVRRQGVEHERTRCESDLGLFYLDVGGFIWIRGAPF